MQEVERLQQEADMLQRLEEVQQEADRLKRSLYQLGKTCSPSYENEETPFVGGNSSGAVDYEDFERMQVVDSSDYSDSDCGSEVEESRLEYTSGNASGHSPVPAPTGMRHEVSNMVKRRQPRNRQSESGVYDETAADRDVENQSSNVRGSSPGRSPRGRRAAAEPRRNSVPARELLRKIATAILTDIDDETLQREDTEMVLIAIALIKEAIIGILIAFAVISFALFLDHQFLLKFPTARNLRRATMSLMNDRETMINMEESSGLKFVDMDEYSTMMDYINSIAKKKALGKSMMEQASADMKKMDKGWDQYWQEWPKLYASLGLDKFCHQCMWSKSQDITCANRVKVLQKTHDTPRRTAIMSAMKKDSCRKSDKGLVKKAKQENQIKAQEGNLLENWAENIEDYCGQCQWEEKMTCDERVSFLNTQYHLTIDMGRMTAMDESKKCKISYQKKVQAAENEKLAKFCPLCQWGPRLTCRQRVEYLVYTYRDTERKAQLNALKKPSCTKGRE